MQAILHLQHVTKTFGELKAVNDVSFSIAAGSITGLIGPNGAGKTTLFNTIAGVLQADSGTIQLAGQRIDNLRPEKIFRTGLARTFQIPRPFAEDECTGEYDVWCPWLSRANAFGIIGCYPKKWPGKSMIYASKLRRS